MVKNKKGNTRDEEKKVALLIKKEAKQEKAAKKRLLKNINKDGTTSINDNDDTSSSADDSDNEDDEAFNQLLRQYKQQQQLVDDDDDDDTSTNMKSMKQQQAISSQSMSTSTTTTKAVLLSKDHPFPFPRANFTCTITDDTKRKEMYIFGGEYYDGTNTIVSDQLFKYDLYTNTWKEIITTNVNSTKNTDSTIPGTNNKVTTTPSPRCAHSAGYYNKAIYIFGGESSMAPNNVSKKKSKKKVDATSATSTTGDYYHYKDIWKFDTVQQTWSEVKPTVPVNNTSIGGKCSTPSPRSGMSMTIWKHYMILFGGFYEAAISSSTTTVASSASTPRWYNDVYVLDLQTEQWMDVPYSKLSNILRPEPRSACNDALIRISSTSDNSNQEEDVWIIHGGFSKLQTNASRQQQQQYKTNTNTTTMNDGNDHDGLPIAETIVYTDTWVLHLQPILIGKPPTWERITTSLSKTKRYDVARTIHNGRSGVSSVSYQNNLLLFGGVLDQELLNHKLDSIFYNDLSIFHYQKRKFLPIQVQEATKDSSSYNNTKSGGGKLSKMRIDDDAVSNVDTVSEAIQELVLENDDNDTIVNRKNVGWDIDKLRTNMFTFVDGKGNVIYEKIDSVIQEEETANKEKVKQTMLERTEPLPRIKAGIFMNGHVLYVYGGLLEVGDREVTLDDMWCIDLRNSKNRVWQCIYPGTMHEQIWRGAINDDDDSYYSNNKNDDEEDDDHDVKASTKINKSSDETILEVPMNQKDDVLEQETLTVAVSQSNNPKQEMIELVERYNMDDDEQTPRPGETISDFFVRTEGYWMEKLGYDNKGNNDKSSNECYIVAQKRYNDLIPIMQRLTELKLLRKKEKAGKSKKDKH